MSMPFEIKVTDNDDGLSCLAYFHARKACFSGCKLMSLKSLKVISLNEKLEWGERKLN